MLSFQLFQIISSVYNNITTSIKNTLKKINNNIPDSIRYKIINIHAFINKKINKHSENVFKVKDNIINKKNNIYNNLINIKKKINDYIQNKLYSYLEKNEDNKIK